LTRPDRFLTAGELNRALLARQLLLGRASLSLPQALERIGGLQTQYAPSAYIGLWSRLREFRREALTRALEQRRVIQATLMRSTIHVVSAADFPLFLGAITQVRREHWLRVQQKLPNAGRVAEAAALLRRELAAGPRRAAELRRAVLAQGFESFHWAGAPLWVDLVRVPPSGTWEQRRADLYGLAQTWVRAAPADEASGLAHIVRRYLGGFGPASVRDIADWAGMAHTRLLPVVEGMRLRHFRDDKDRELIDLPSAPLPDAATPAPVRFLPTWDATLLVHARRTQILPERYRPLVFNTKTPHSVPTFLVDGAVAGTWRYDGGRVAIKPFEPLPKAARREVDDEARRLAEFHA
jgi:winged helix DNA-binding protein